jgi:hypothetical protein
VSYSKFTDPGGGRVDSVVARARHDGAGWINVEQPPASGTCPPLDVDGNPRRATFDEVVTEPDGTLSQTVRDCDKSSWVNFQVDPTTLTSAVRPYAAFSPVPGRMAEVEYRSTNGEICDGPATTSPLEDNAPVRTTHSRRDATDGRQFFLRWSRVTKDHFDRPAWCLGDPLRPTALTVHEASQ